MSIADAPAHDDGYSDAAGAARHDMSRWNRRKVVMLAQQHASYTEETFDIST